MEQLLSRWKTPKLMNENVKSVLVHIQVPDEFRSKIHDITCTLPVVSQ